MTFSYKATENNYSIETAIKNSTNVSTSSNGGYSKQWGIQRNHYSASFLARPLGNIGMRRVRELSIVDSVCARGRVQTALQTQVRVHLSLFGQYNHGWLVGLSIVSRSTWCLKTGTCLEQKHKWIIF